MKTEDLIREYIKAHKNGKDVSKRVSLQPKPKTKPSVGGASKR